MRGLLFPVDDVVEEFQIMEGMAKDFIDPATTYLLQETSGLLKSFGSNRKFTGASSRWTIPEDRPLRTIWSEGESAPDRKGAYRLQAELTFVWEIRRVAQQDQKKWPGRFFLLDGLASTVVRLKGRKMSSVDEPTELACWRIEVGDHQSPGTHFHVQISNNDGLPFPKDLDVPRLPAMVMTPMLVFEFVLAELFQDRWSKVAATINDSSLRRWRNLHTPRLIAFFEWQRNRLLSSHTGTPIASLKSDRPARDLFVKGLER